MPGIQQLHQRHNEWNHWHYEHHVYNLDNCNYRHNGYDQYHRDHRNNRHNSNDRHNWHHGNNGYHCDHRHDWNYHEYDIDDQHNWKSDRAQQFQPIFRLRGECQYRNCGYIFGDFRECQQHCPIDDQRARVANCDRSHTGRKISVSGHQR